MNTKRVIPCVAACLILIGTGGCIQSPYDMPHDTVISMDRDTLVPPDCSNMESPSALTDAGMRRPSVPWGCATYTNLAAQIANPEHFNHPAELGPADAAVAASAVRRYEAGNAKAVDTSSSRSSQ